MWGGKAIRAIKTNCMHLTHKLRIQKKYTVLKDLQCYQCSVTPKSNIQGISYIYLPHKSARLAVVITVLINWPLLTIGISQHTKLHNISQYPLLLYIISIILNDTINFTTAVCKNIFTFQLQCNLEAESQFISNQKELTALL